MSRYSTPRKQEAIEKTKEPKVNLWSNLLKESLKHAQIPAGSCVFVGNSLCGKNLLVDKICASPVVAEEEEDLSKEVVSYDHFEVEEGLETNINIWSFGEEIFDNASEILKHSHKTDKVAELCSLTILL